MWNLQTRFVPNDEEIAIKVIDGEAIMVNLSNGVYYSLDGAGCTAWMLLDAGYSLEETGCDVVARYDAGAERIIGDLRRLAERLVSERIALPSDRTEPRRRRDEITDLPNVGAKLAYEPMELVAYRDMEDLLALDPPMPNLKDIPWKDPGESES